MDETWRGTAGNGDTIKDNTASVHGEGTFGQDAQENARQVCRAARKQFSRLGWMYVAGTVVIEAVGIGIMLVVGLIWPQWLIDTNMQLLLGTLPMYLIGIPILVLLVKTVPAQQPRQHRMRGGQFALAALMCFAAMYICNFAGLAITTIIGILKGSPVNNQLQDMIGPSNPVLVFVFTVICAPLIEEYVFRKLIVDRAIQYGQGAAIVLSGLMFGLFHGNMNQFVYATGLGLFLAFLYVRTGKLKITIALHMLINFFGGVVSTQVVRLADMDAYMEAASAGNLQDMMGYLADHMAGWILLLGYVFVVLGCALAGGVLFIVFACKGRFRLGADKAVLPKGKRFRTVMLNSGILVYCIIWMAVIGWQLFA